MSRDDSASRRSTFINLGLAAVAFLLFGAALHSKWDKIREVFDSGIDRPRFAIAFGFYVAGLLLTFFRWYLLVRALNLPLSIIDAFRLGFIGNLFNLVIPGAVGGDVIKAVFLARAQPRKTAAIASMVIDRILGLAGLFILAAVAGIGAYGSASGQVRTVIVAVWVSLAAGFLILGALFTPKLYPKLNRLAAGRRKLERVLVELEGAAGAYRGSLGRVFLCLAISSTIHSLYVVAFFLVGGAMFPRVPSLANHFLIVPLVLFSMVVPLPFGALGVTEQASGLLFRMVAHPSGELGMMGFRVLMYAGGLLSAAVYLTNLKQVRDLRSRTSARAASLGVPDLPAD